MAILGTKSSIIDQIWTTPKSIEDYRRRSEFLVVWTQVSVVAFLIALYLIAPAPRDAMNPFLYMAILLTYFLWLLVLVVATHTGPLPRTLLWGSLVADFTALFALIWAIHMHYGQSPGFYLKAPTNDYIFIIIMLRVLRFEPRLIIGAGVIAIAGKLGLAVYVQATQGNAGVTTSYIDYMTNNSLLWGAEIDSMVVIAIVTLVLAFTADRARVMLRHQIDTSADLERKQQSLQKAALIDSFTGLPNRQAAPQILKDARSSKSQPIGVVVIRIGGLGRSLTIFGSRFAEEIVSAVKDGLLNCKDESEHLLRLDDDSFLLIVTHSADAPYLAGRAETIIRHFKEPLRISDRRVPVRLKIGISVSLPDSDPDEALKSARTAVYNVRHDQSPPVSFFDERMIQSTKRFVEIEIEMRHSLDAGLSFEPFYQPIVDVTTGAIVGFEALARWTLPNGENISPVEFIPVAEASGMIVPLGRRIFECAAKDLAAFNQDRADKPNLFMGINVSIRQLQDPKFIVRVKNILTKTNCPPELIKVEITESLSAQEGDDFCSKIHALRDLGMKVAIDDFGTGYSSLSYLHSLPFNSLKIDQSFIRGLEDGKDRTALVKSIVDIANAFELESIAEGIEDEATYQFVKNMGVNLGQGYYFSRPCSFQDSLGLLAAEAMPEKKLFP